MEMKRRSKMQKTFFFCLTQKKESNYPMLEHLVPVQNILYWFKKFCTGSKNLVLVQKVWYWFKNSCTKGKIELQHLYQVYYRSEGKFEREKCYEKYELLTSVSPAFSSFPKLSYYAKEESGTH